ncbi:MAG: VOC family protein [Pseudomonadota bacterium]
MPATPATTRATVVPCLRYRDAPGAIEWLCHTFGFAKHLVVPGEFGSIAHAQLSFGNGMIMLASSQTGGEFDCLFVQPEQIEGAQTQSVYVVVADADAVWRSVQAANATIVSAIRDQDYGGRGFSCRDLEGHIWSFGTYDPA